MNDQERKEMEDAAKKEYPLPHAQSPHAQSMVAMHLEQSERKAFIRGYTAAMERMEGKIAELERSLQEKDAEWTSENMRRTIAKRVIIDVVSSIDWNEQNASRFFIGEDAAQIALMCLGFDFNEGLSNESVESFVAKLNSGNER